MTEDQPASKRVFIGVKIRDDIKPAIQEALPDMENLPLRLMHPQDWHLTIIPPWLLTDKKEVLDKMEAAVRYIPPFNLYLQELKYGPALLSSRLLWITCQASDELERISSHLHELFQIPEKKPYLPHITIARFKKSDRDRLIQEQLERPIVLTMMAEEITLFRSLPSGFPKYEVIESVRLRG